MKCVAILREFRIVQASARALFAGVDFASPLRDGNAATRNDTRCVTLRIQCRC